MLQRLVRERSNPYLDESVKGSKKQNNTIFVWDEAWHSQHSVVVEVGQLVDRWAVLEGQHKRPKVIKG